MSHYKPSDWFPPTAGENLFTSRDVEAIREGARFCDSWEIPGDAIGPVWRDIALRMEELAYAEMIAPDPLPKADELARTITMAVWPLLHGAGDESMQQTVARVLREQGVAE